MTDNLRPYYLGFEIQHIFANEIATKVSLEADKGRALLQSVDFDYDSRSNQMALNYGDRITVTVHTIPELLNEMR